MELIEQSTKKSRHRLEYLPSRAGFDVRFALDGDIPDAIDLTAAHLPEAPIDPSAVWEIHRVVRGIVTIRRNSQLVGAAAFLPLNDVGLTRLLSGGFPIRRPDMSLMVRPGQRAVAIYNWSLCVPGRVVASMGQVMALMRQPDYHGVDIYAWPATPVAVPWMQRIGFEKLDVEPDGKPLHVYRRS